MKKTAARPEERELRRLRREVAKLRAAIEILHRISNLVGSALELEPACYAVLTAVTAGVGLGLNRAMLFLADEEAPNLLRGAAAIGPANRAEADRVWRSIEAEAHDLETLYEAGLRHHKNPCELDARIRRTTVDGRGKDPVALAFRNGAVVRASGEDDAGGLFHATTSIAAPLRDPRGVTGVLYADNFFTGRRIDPITEQVFSMVADQAGRAIANARRFEEVAGAARTDALTGLRHHGTFMTDLGRETTAALTEGRPLGLCIVDLDGFKRVNDRLGHLAGDALLGAVAGRMRAVIRGGEGVYRYGGDEFAVLVPGGDRAAASVVGERIHAALSSQPFALRDERAPLRVTCSVGVAALPEDAGDALSLVAAADAAMFKAKSRGRDLVERAGERESAPPPS